MATTRAKAQKSKRRKARTEAYLILFFIFMIGFVLGFVFRSLAYAEEPVKDTVSIPVATEIIEPCPIKIETEEQTIEPKTIIETEEQTIEPKTIIETEEQTIEPETIIETEEQTIEPETIIETEAEPIPEEPVTIYFDCPLPKELQDYIFGLCEEENVPASLVIALIDHESRFKADAISKTKDYGLMQINACNHEWLKETYGINEILDPKQNILGGIKILGSICRKYTDPHKILMSYNMGEDGMKKAWKAGRTSTSYSVEVLKLWNSYQSSYETEVNSGTQSN